MDTLWVCRSCFRKPREVARETILSNCDCRLFGMIFLKFIYKNSLSILVCFCSRSYMFWKSPLGRQFIVLWMVLFYLLFSRLLLNKTGYFLGNSVEPNSEILSLRGMITFVFFSIFLSVAALSGSSRLYISGYY